MRDYGKVYTAFWTSEDVRSMSDDGRFLSLYLLTCHHGNMLGCFRLTNAYVADDLQWESERVSKGFKELHEKRFAYRCEKTYWVIIRQYLKWNSFDNPNVGKAAGKLFDTLPATNEVKAMLSESLIENCDHFPNGKAEKYISSCEPYQNRFETVSKSVVGAVAAVVSEVGEGTAAKQDIVATPSAAAKKPAKIIDPEKQQACKATWQAYADAYFNRYGAEPVRNAKVNGQIVNIVERLGYQESPAVAAFFVSHQNSFYVRDMHTVGILQKDCEKLRTEWATNTRMTQTKALQADKTASNFDAFAPLIAAAKAKEEQERMNNAE